MSVAHARTDAPVDALDVASIAGLLADGVVVEASEPAASPARVHEALLPGDPRARYSEHVHAAGRDLNVEPALIHAVILVESGYNPSARSSQGALGLMQLMPGTAKRYGVENPLDPAQNIQGGARYLRDLLRMFDNDLDRVLAAYHAGEHTVMKHGSRIPPGRATLAFVTRVLTYYRKSGLGSQMRR